MVSSRSGSSRWPSHRPVHRFGSWLAAALPVLLLALAAGPARALSLEDVAVTVQVGSNSETVAGMTLSGASTSDDDLDASDGTLLLQEGDLVIDGEPGDGYTGSGGGWQLTDWQLEIEGDPFLGVILGIANLTGQTQSFDILIQTGVGPVVPQSLLDGSLGNFFDLVLGSLSDSGNPLYAAEIDGAGVAGATLVPAPFSVTGSLLSPGHIGSDAFSGVIGPPVASTIGLRFRFDLAPLSAALFDAKLKVVAVPEPATALLLGLGLLALATRRRP